MNISDTSRPQFLTVTEDRSGQRLDNLLIALLKGVPKTRIYRLLRKGEVRVNKGRAKPDYRVLPGDILRLPPIRIATRKNEPLNPLLNSVRMLGQRVLQQTASWLVINKPTGMAVHGGSGVSFGVIEALRALHPDWPYLELVHRLDRDTSGALLLALKRSRLRFFHEQLRNKRMGKRYLCLVHGHWKNANCEVNAAITRSSARGGERVMAAIDLADTDAQRQHHDAKAARTRFRCLASCGETSLLLAEPVTGRTHQIRVHTAHVGAPIVGDEKYRRQAHLKQRESGWGSTRLMLHAYELQFTEGPGEPAHIVRAPLDSAFKGVLQTAGYNLSDLGLEA